MSFKTNNEKFIIFLLIIWPYLYLFPHTFQFLEMGNDFELLYFSYKKYIFEFIRIGHFPKWLPTDSSGYSLIFNPFAQYFYPLSWLLYLIAIITGDLSQQLFLLYTIFGLSIYNVGQYLWLKELKIESKYALIATIITCCGLKLTEILRFPNAVHAIAWFPWILLAITLATNKINKIKSATIIFISTLMIFTAGYPYYILYGFILFSLYFFFLLTEKIKLEIFNIEKKYLQNKINFFFTCSIPVIISTLIVSPWFLKIKEIMSITTNRNLEDISFSFILSSNFLDQISSWIFPPYALAEGWYYFGIINTVLLIFFVLNFFIFKNNSKKDKYFLLLFVSILIVNYQFAAAESSYIFKFLWNKIDFIKNFRIFSRMNIILVPIISIIIALSIKKITEIKQLDKKNIYKKLTLLSSIIFFIFIIQIYLINYYDFNNVYWDTWQLKRLHFAAQNLKLLSKIFLLHDNYWYSIFTFLALSLCFLLILKINQKIIYLLIIVLTVSELFIMANIQWAIPKNYYNQDSYNNINKNPLLELQNGFKKSNISTEIKGNSYFRNNRNFNINYFDDFGIGAHSKLIDKYFLRNGQFKKNLSLKETENIKFFWALGKNKRKIFFSKSIKHKNINAFVDDVKINEDLANVKIDIDIEKYNGDELFLTVNSLIDGYITVIDNWSPGWTVKINNNKGKIEKNFNTYKSVKINKGTNQLYFKYKPWYE